MAIDSTIGGSSANSYVSLSDADSYFLNESMSPGGWTTESPTLKQKSLITATFILDRYVKWTGVIASESQRLKWPRSGIYDSDSRTISSTTIPDDIKYATYELAKHLISTGGFNPESAGELDQMKIGPIQLDFSGFSQTSIPQHVKDIVSQYGIIGLSMMSGGVTNIPLVRA